MRDSGLSITTSHLARAALMEDSVQLLDALIRSGARRLTGHQRRSFQAEVAVELCGGNARQAERRFGWGRETVEKGLRLMRGRWCVITLQPHLSRRISGGRLDGSVYTWSRPWTSRLPT